jgi:hypothetical protein
VWFEFWLRLCDSKTTVTTKYSAINSATISWILNASSPLSTFLTHAFFLLLPLSPVRTYSTDLVPVLRSIAVRGRGALPCRRLHMTIPFYRSPILHSSCSSLLPSSYSSSPLPFSLLNFPPSPSFSSIPPSSPSLLLSQCGESSCPYKPVSCSILRKRRN